MRVRNRAVLRRLTWRSLKAGRFRNFIAVCAIILTTVLFTSITTLGGALMQTVQESTFRQVGTSAHGGYKHLTQAQYDRILESDRYKDISYDIILGFATNPELAKKQHELRYAEDKKAQWGFSYPTVGTMPKKDKDVALATTTLDLLGLPHVLGQAIHLEFMVNGVPHADDFTLVGIWPGDQVLMAVQVYLSRDYVRRLAPDPGICADDGACFANADQMSGTINADVWFTTAVNIEARLNRLLMEQGLDASAIYTGVNWAYTTSGELDLQSVLLLSCLPLLVMGSGYLIIYSVFAISVSGDIRFYGLLKTIGTTGRQIRGIVRGQALILSAAGIPIGLALGFFLGVRLSPSFLAMTYMQTPTAIKANPLIFLLAAIFSLITVFLSCSRPGRMAARVSPVEAVTYAEGEGKPKKRKKRARRVTALTMGLANVGRGKRRLIAVVLSLTLSLTLLCGVESLIRSFDMDTYLKKQVIADFLVSDSTLLTSVGARDDNFEGIPPELMGSVDALRDLEARARIFFQEYKHTFESGARLDRLIRIVKANLDLENPYTKTYIDQVMRVRSDTLHLYGMDRMAFDRLEQNFQGIDWDKFNSGNYVLMRTYDGSDGASHPDQALYGIGEKFPLQNANGDIVEYEVLGSIEIPFPMTCQHAHMCNFDMIVPAEAYLSLFPGRQPMSVIFDVADGSIDETQRWVEDLCENRLKSLNYRSRATLLNEFSTLLNTFRLLGGVLSLILGLIGILNFVNAMATSILSRRRELAMLQSVGMTGRQVRFMLFFEGLWYAIFTLGLTLTAGMALGAALLQGIAGHIWFFKLNFSPEPVLLCAPILVALCAVIPLLCGALLNREGLVSRLREA